MPLRTEFRIRAANPGERKEKEGGTTRRPLTGVAPAKRAAVLIIHGMGQQVPFETVSTLAQGILTEPPVEVAGSWLGNRVHSMLRAVHGIPKVVSAASPQPTVRRAQLTPNGDPLSRVEFALQKKGESGDGGSVEVHVYEAYWAPLTEGQISFTETIAFLFSSGFDGLISSLRGRAFQRWMFGRFQNCHVKLGTFLALLAAIVGLAFFLAPAIAYSYVAKETLKALWDAFSNPLHVSWTTVAGHKLALAVMLAGVFLYAWWIRRIVVQYVGDVAIYVSSHTVNRFYETRHRIQEVALKTAQQIYSAQNPPGASETGANYYDRVVIAGHSLGSVIAYDTLNAAINWDLVEQGGKQQVVRRTSDLITFGSPLDKTAFLFRTQVSNARFLREALAALQQPMILSYADFRPSNSFRWVNLYSRMDIVSGRLSYYDWDGKGVAPPGLNRVCNETDIHAWIPLYAHVQYWSSPALHEVLRVAILR